MVNIICQGCRIGSFLSARLHINEKAVSPKVAAATAAYKAIRLYGMAECCMADGIGIVLTTAYNYWERRPAAGWGVWLEYASSIA